MYALQKGKPWKNTNVREFRIFIGLHIIMVCTKFPRIRIYWDVVLKMNVFIENMNRNSFFALRTNFIFFDNYFSGYNLMEALNQKKIYAIGTIREKRFAYLPFLKNKVMASKGQGTTDEITNIENTITLVKLYDNKSVNMCSNFIASGIPDTVQRWNKRDKKYVSVERSEVVRLCYQSMGVMDKFDQLINYYRIFLKSKKWTLRMVFHAVDMAVINSWLEYYLDCKKLKIPTKERMDLLNCRLRLADNLINVGKFATPKRPRCRPREGASLDHSSSSSPPKKRYNSKEVRPFDETKTDQIGHIPVSDNNTEATRCKNKNFKGKTHVYCLKCKLYLCFVVKKNIVLQNIINDFILIYVNKEKLNTFFVSYKKYYHNSY